MKALTCDMCGSNDVLKQDGLFICQVCGTKYSVDEARRMMIEGTVDISGSTVKVDHSESAKAYYILAASAFSAKNYEEAEKYSTKVIEIDPENYEAWYIKGKAAGLLSTLAKLRVEECVHCFSKSIQFAPEDKIDEMKMRIADDYPMLCSEMISISCRNFINHPNSDNADIVANHAMILQKCAVYLMRECDIRSSGEGEAMASWIETAVNHAWPSIWKEYDGIDGHANKYVYKAFIKSCLECISLLKIAITVNGDVPENNIPRYQTLIQITQDLNKACSWTRISNSKGYTWTIENKLTKKEKEENINKIMEYHQKIKEIDPSYVIPKRPGSGACYVATCVYGSYDCPEVWTLRRYRDEQLAKTWRGRIFIRVYYAVSPTIVHLFGNQTWFRKLWKQRLDKMVGKLRSQGVDNTPYEDKLW